MTKPTHKTMAVIEGELAEDVRLVHAALHYHCCSAAEGYILNSFDRIEIALRAKGFVRKPLHKDPNAVCPTDDISKAVFGLRLYADMLEGGDKIWHVVGHVRAVCSELERAKVEPQVSEACKHKRTIRGADIPRRYGSYRSQVCINCCAFRQMTHHNKPHSKWLPADQYNAAIMNEEEEPNV